MSTAGLEGILQSALSLARFLPERAGLVLSAVTLAALGFLILRHRRELKRRRLAHERYASLFENNTDSVVAIDPNGAITGANPAFARLSGYSSEELLGVAIPSLLTAADRREVLESLQGVSNGRSKTVETVLLHREGREVAIELTTVPIAVDGEIVGAYHIVRDETERKEFEERLEARALHDYMTSLPNRALFTDRLEHAVQRVRRHGGRVALLYMDLDGFKLVNDTAGHASGDALLVDVASRLRCFLRDGDTVARLGGDEFAILLEDVVDEEEAISAAERVVDLLNQSFKVAEKEVHIGASVGVALSGPATEKPEEIVRQADMAMYEAKRRGGYRHQLYTEELESSQPDDSLHLQSDLRRAIEQEELVLHYQPIVDLAGTQIVGVEALVRWEHPIHGMLLPSSFIPLAENAGLIIQLDRWVLERGCEDVQRLIDKRAMGFVGERFFLSVNLSARHFEDDDLVDEIFSVLESAKLAAEHLQLEITETAAGQGMERISRLKKLGVRVAIDDFGTGYSSLSYLRDLDVDVLKIDRSFVTALGGDPASLAIVRTILTLAEMLDMEVIIEGIEDPVQLQKLQDLGGRLVQGFYFGKAMGVEELETVLRRGLPPAWIYRPGSGIGLQQSDKKQRMAIER